MRGALFLFCCVVAPNLSWVFHPAMVLHHVHPSGSNLWVTGGRAYYMYSNAESALLHLFNEPGQDQC